MNRHEKDEALAQQALDEAKHLRLKAKDLLRLDEEARANAPRWDPGQHWAGRSAARPNPSLDLRLAASALVAAAEELERAARCLRSRGEWPASPEEADSR